MVRQYEKRRLKSGAFLFTCALLLVLSAAVFPLLARPPEGEWTWLRAYAVYFSEPVLLALWLPLYSVFLVFPQRYFTPNALYSRFGSFWSLWKHRLAVLLLDSLLFAVLLQAGYFLYCALAAPVPPSGAEALLALRCFFTQLGSLALYGCLCTVLVTLFRKTALGLLAAYALAAADFCVGNAFRRGPLVFAKGFYIPGSWPAAGKTLLLFALLFAALLALLWCFAAQRDPIIEGGKMT